MFVNIYVSIILVTLGSILRFSNATCFHWNFKSFRPGYVSAITSPVSAGTVYSFLSNVFVVKSSVVAPTSSVNFSGS